MLEINCIDSNKEQIDSNVLETLKEYLNLEKNILEKEIEIRNRKIDLAKDPSNNGIIDNIKDLEEQLVKHITQFLLELGAGFAFVGRQYHLEIGGDDYYIDLLFYHLKLKCYVVIELKTVEFQPEFARKVKFLFVCGR